MSIQEGFALGHHAAAAAAVVVARGPSAGGGTRQVNRLKF